MASNNEIKNSSWAISPQDQKKEPTVMDALGVIFAKLNTMDAKIDVLSKIQPVVSSTTKPTLATPVVDPKLDKINKEFGEDIQYVKIEDKGDIFYIKATKFLGSEVFAKVGAHTRVLKAIYISDKANTHWELKKSDIKV
jgi:hypothetical protein